MRVAIRFARMNRLPAEFEGLIAWVPGRPAALIWAKVSKTKTVRLVGFLLWNRVRPSLKTQAMHLADHGVLGDTQAIADGARRQALVPKGDQGADLEGSPVGLPWATIR